MPRHGRQGYTSRWRWWHAWFFWCSFFLAFGRERRWGGGRPLQLLALLDGFIFIVSSAQRATGASAAAPPFSPCCGGWPWLRLLLIGRWSSNTVPNGLGDFQASHIVMYGDPAFPLVIVSQKACNRLLGTLFDLVQDFVSYVGFEFAKWSSLIVFQVPINNGLQSLIASMLSVPTSSPQQNIVWPRLSDEDDLLLRVTLFRGTSRVEIGDAIISRKHRGLGSCPALFHPYHSVDQFRYTTVRSEEVIQRTQPVALRRCLDYTQELTC